MKRLTWKAIRFTAAAAMLGTLFASSMVAQSSSSLRKSPDFQISEPSGKTTQLSALRGKVVVLEFFFLQSNHCIRVAEMLNKLNADLGPRGFQALGVVFDPPNSPNSHGRLIPPAVDYFKLAYPVGYASKSAVDSFLDRKQKQILAIPQIVIIDRSGMIRASTGGPSVDASLENESTLRALADKLLKEGAGLSAANH